jgi:hypothetical protein
MSRRKFRWYWARFSAGIVLIRELSMRLVKDEAEKRTAAAGPGRDVSIDETRRGQAALRDGAAASATAAIPPTR